MSISKIFLQNIEDNDMVENNSSNIKLSYEQPPATEQLAPNESSIDCPLVIQPSSDILTTATPLCRPISKKRKVRDTDSSIELQEQAAINRCMEFLSTSKPRDEFSIFGEYVSNELRLLGTAPDLQFKLKYDIQQLIINAGLQNGLRQFGSSSALSSSSHNSGQLLTSPPLSSNSSTQNSENSESQWEDQGNISRQDPSNNK